MSIIYFPSPRGEKLLNRIQERREWREVQVHKLPIDVKPFPYWARGTISTILTSQFDWLQVLCTYWARSSYHTWWVALKMVLCILVSFASCYDGGHGQLWKYSHCRFPGSGISRFLLPRFSLSRITLSWRTMPTITASCSRVNIAVLPPACSSLQFYKK